MVQQQRSDRDRPLKQRPDAALKRRPYTKPALQEYGSIAKLTQSGGSTRTEFGGGMRSCL